jgi:hypothetical protein
MNIVEEVKAIADKGHKKMIKVINEKHNILRKPVEEQRKLLVISSKKQ